jgi:hypothetical protein
MKNITAIKEPELLVNDSHGIYVMQSFCKVYAAYITNMDEVKEDFDICVEGPDNEDYYDAWDSLLNNVKFTNDAGEPYYMGNLGEGGDLWAIPEGYEYPED